MHQEIQATETIEHFPAPKTPEALEKLIHDRLAGSVTEVDEQEINEQKLHWRGLDPSEALALIAGAREIISLRSDKPNTTLDWRKAISYGRGETDYQLALGFLPADDWRIEPAMTRVPSDLHQFPEVLAYQRGNFIVNGDLEPEQVRYLIVRAKGQKPGHVGRPRYFRVQAKRLGA